MTNFKVTAPLALLSALAFCACGGSNKTVNWDAACADTPEGSGCVTLHVSMTDSVFYDQQSVKLAGNKSLIDPLLWALYKASDVTDTGPVNGAVRVDEGIVPSADFSVHGATVDIVIKDVAPQEYRALILMDEFGTLLPAIGDPASTPANFPAFDVPADVHTTYDIALDLVTPTLS